MKLDENFRIETFNQLLSRFYGGLGKWPVLRYERPLEIQRLVESIRSMNYYPQARAVYFIFEPSVKWTVHWGLTERSKRVNGPNWRVIYPTTRSYIKLNNPKDQEWTVFHYSGPSNFKFLDRLLLFFDSLEPSILYRPSTLDHTLVWPVFNSDRRYQSNVRTLMYDSNRIMIDKNFQFCYY